MELTRIRNIGQGGFGIVDEVENNKGEKFACKTFQVNQPLPLSASLEDNVKKRFKREAQLQSLIKHENIVPVLHLLLDKTPPRFLMPLAVNSLEHDLTLDKTLGGKYMNALMDIIAGLEELHSLRYYHRDLKPANVLRFKRGNGEDYYAIGDFGLMSVQQTNVSSLTQTGMRMGSDFYTAPEIVKDLKNATAQSDIFSIGCIIHDMVGKEDRIPMSEISEKGDFSAILLGCTRKDPKRRFKSVTALREALLSLGDIKIKPKTEKGAEIFDILVMEPEAIDEKKWKEVIAFVQDEYKSADSIAAMRKITLAHLDDIIKKYPDIAAELGLMYAKWIREGSFDFDECDGLSIRLNKFIASCPIDVQSECLLSMLYMGTNHNRFYVERKFVGLVGKALDNDIARRLSIEFRVEDIDLCKAIRHLKDSINFSISSLHPLLLQTVNDICS